MMNKTMYTLILATLASTSLISCSLLEALSIDSKGNGNKPNKLLPLNTSIKVLQPVIEVDIGGGRVAKKDPLKLQPVIDDNKVYAASRSGEMNAVTLNAFRVWLVDLQQQITGGVAYDKTNKTLIVSTRNGEIVAMDSQKGTVKWKTQLPATVLAPATISTKYQRAMLSANNGYFYGLDVKTGLLVWQFSSPVPKISFRGSAKPKLYDDDTVLFSSANGRIYALNIDTGVPLWSHRITESDDVKAMMDLDGAAIIRDKKIYSTSFNGQLVAIDANHNKSVYLDTVSSLHQPVVTDKLVIVSDINGIVTAYDKVTGKTVWNNRTLKNRRLTNPVELNDYIAIGDIKGVVHLMQKNTGTIVSRVNTHGSLNHLQVIGNKLVTQSNSGRIAIWQW